MKPQTHASLDYWYALGARVLYAGNLLTPLQARTLEQAFGPAYLDYERSTAV